jgi:hypothetical protein
MTEHEQRCFNDALHKAKVRDTELRIRRKLDHKLNQLSRMNTDEQMSHLFKLEEALV